MEVEKQTELEPLHARKSSAASLRPEARAVPAPPRDAAEPPRILLVAALFKLPYQALRCLAASDARVYVLGGPDARGLRYSRYCERFFRCGPEIDGTASPDLARAINHVIEGFSIDLVVAGDAPATRSLVELSKDLKAACFPMPDIKAFDLLNNKWRFTQLCKTLDITCPESRLYHDVRRLLFECRYGLLDFPIIAKPLSQDGGAGCIQVDGKAQIDRLLEITYNPIITQRYIAGSDIGASIFCRDGAIEAYLAHSYADGLYMAYSDPAIHDAISRLAWRLRLTGIFNFDMRLTPDGRVFFLECNPRVYYKIAMSMLAGINFLDLGLPWRAEAEKTSFSVPVMVQFPKAMLPSLLRPWELDDGAWRVLKFLFEDPLPYLRQSSGLERGR